MKIETIAVHAGRSVDASTGAVTPPLYLSTTFERDADGSYPHGFLYARNNNPTRASLEEALAALEGGVAAAAFSSGSAATMTIFQSLTPGDHVIAPNDIYHGTTRVLSEVMGPWGLEATFVDTSDIAQIETAIKKSTKIIWLETPSNPLLKISDIKKISELSHAHNVLCVCDNTWAPIIQRPFDLGADIVMHSTTKYLGGHSDVLGGAVITKHDDDFFRRIKKIQETGGAVAAPFDSWLVLRGLQTLPGRMRTQSENALRVATFLSLHKNVDKVHYPGLQKNAFYELASKQMSLHGGMVSIEVKGGKEEAMRVASRVKIFRRATSLGGTESLIEHRASIEGTESRTPQNLLRLSIGLEHPDDLIADLSEALHRS